ncbi:MAG: hypothetical protein LBH32_07720 [Dysgonamonadaceae bacterium]|jgi:hypothetical protein|nr:hypothetical protein [Dysgonamonadaceae bacterium]
MRIAQAQVAVIFSQDNDIILTLGSSLKKMQEQYQGNVQVLNNIPEFVPPDVPRMVFNCANFVVNVALMRIDIMINPPHHICSDATKVFEYLDSLISSLNDLLIKRNVQYEWTGLVLTFEFPKDEKRNIRSLEYFGPIFDKLINIKRHNKRMASFSFQYGFDESPFFVNYSINGYEKFNVTFPNIFHTAQTLPAVAQEITEAGIAITLDVNNRLQEQKVTFKEDFTSISSKVMSLYKTLLNDTGLRDFV